MAMTLNWPLIRFFMKKPSTLKLMYTLLEIKCQNILLTLLKLLLINNKSTRFFFCVFMIPFKLRKVFILMLFLILRGGIKNSIYSPVNIVNNIKIKYMFVFYLLSKLFDTHILTGSDSSGLVRVCTGLEPIIFIEDWRENKRSLAHFSFLFSQIFYHSLNYVYGF